MQKLFHCKIEQSGPNPSADLVPQHFVACMYDDEWWIGMVEGIEGDIFNINFMHQKGLIPNSGFHWPRRPDLCQGLIQVFETGTGGIKMGYFSPN